MVGKIIVFIICIMAAVLTFRVEWVLKTFFKRTSPDEKQIMKLKYIALFLAVLAFITVLISQ